MVDHVAAGAPAGARSKWTVSRVDLLLAAVSLVLGSFDDAFAPGTGLVEDKWISIVINAALSVLLILRRRYPTAIAVIALIGHAIAQVGWAFAVSMYTVAAETRMARTVWIVAAAAVIIPLEPWWIGGDAPRLSDLTTELVFIAGPAAVGAYVRTRRELVRSLMERADRLEREQELLTEQALYEERGRIAREMHDVVGHRMSLVVLHAGALVLSTKRDPERIAEVAELIRDSAQKALEELRHTVAMLTRYTEAPSPGPPTTVAEIERLVAQSRAAGLPVSLHLEGNRRPMTGTVERAAYRVVQEALTNVHKHAPGAKTAVVVRFLRTTVEVVVINEGPRGNHQDKQEFPRGGHGLAGLRERVSLLGGELHAGPLPLGGFRVLATLPLVQATPDTSGPFS